MKMKIHFIILLFFILLISCSKGIGGWGIYEYNPQKAGGDLVDYIQLDNSMFGITNTIYVGDSCIALHNQDIHIIISSYYDSELILDKEILSPKGYKKINVTNIPHPNGSDVFNMVDCYIDSSGLYTMSCVYQNYVELTDDTIFEKRIALLTTTDLSSDWKVYTCSQIISNNNNFIDFNSGSDFVFYNNFWFSSSPDFDSIQKITLHDLTEDQFTFTSNKDFIIDDFNNRFNYNFDLSDDLVLFHNPEWRLPYEQIIFYNLATKESHMIQLIYLNLHVLGVEDCIHKVLDFKWDGEYFWVLGDAYTYYDDARDVDKFFIYKIKPFFPEGW